MVATVTLIDKSDGTTIVQRGTQYIMSFPTKSCRDMAEKMQAQLNAPGGWQRLDELKIHYREEKRKRGVRFGKKGTNHNPGMDDVPETDGIRAEDKAEDKERRIGYSVGLTVQEIDQRLVLLPTLIDQARDAKAKVQLAQGEVAKLWYENHRAWQAVAEAVLGIDNELRKALEQELARSQVPEGREI